MSQRNLPVPALVVHPVLQPNMPPQPRNAVPHPPPRPSTLTDASEHGWQIRNSRNALCGCADVRQTWRPEGTFGPPSNHRFRRGGAGNRNARGMHWDCNTGFA